MAHTDPAFVRQIIECGASNLHSFVDKLEAKPFEPSVFRNEAGECYEAYWANVPTRAEQINKSLTLYRCVETNEVVGVQIIPSEITAKAKRYDV